MQFTDVPPSFPGDDFDALRGIQHTARKDTIRGFANCAIEQYKNAWKILGRPADPIKDCLDVLAWIETDTLLEGHNMLSAYWRKSNGLLQPTFPQIMHIDDLLSDWQVWLFNTVRSWSDLEPMMIRHICLILVNPNVVSGILEEWSLAIEIARLYPLNRATDRKGGIIFRRPSW